MIGNFVSSHWSLVQDYNSPIHFKEVMIFSFEAFLFIYFEFWVCHAHSKFRNYYLNNWAILQIYYWKQFINFLFMAIRIGICCWNYLLSVLYLSKIFLHISEDFYRSKNVWEMMAKNHQFNWKLIQLNYGRRKDLKWLLIGLSIF